MPDTNEAPHFDRTAFRTPKRIFATLAADRRSANLRLASEQQAWLSAMKATTSSGSMSRPCASSTATAKRCTDVPNRLASRQASSNSAIDSGAPVSTRCFGGGEAGIGRAIRGGRSPSRNPEIELVVVRVEVVTVAISIDRRPIGSASLEWPGTGPSGRRAYRQYHGRLDGFLLT